MYKVYLTEAGIKRYICLACGMKKSSSKERIISHLRSRHFHLISDRKFKCKSTILDNNEIQYSIQWNNKDYYENKEDKRIRVCPICFKMWPNWSRRDFSHHEIMCKLLELEYIYGMSERSRIVERLIQDLQSKFNKV